MELNLLFLAAFAAFADSIQIQHPLQTHTSHSTILPQATSFIYRSDNDGPASLLQLGGQQQLYRQPVLFAAPIPVTAQALLTKAVSSSPQLNDYLAAKAAKIEQESVENATEEKDDSARDGEEGEDVEYEEYDEDDGEAGDDEYYEEEPEESARLSEQHKAHHKGFQEESGHDYEDEKSSSHGGKERKDYDSKHHFNRGESGHHEDEDHKEFFHGDKAHKNKHLDEASKQGEHHEEKGGSNGDEFEHKKNFKKGEKVTGFHNVYKKDEFKKNKEFFDESNESGHFKKHGDKHFKFGLSEGGRKQVAHHDSGHVEAAAGKKGHYEKEDHDEHEKGHDNKGGEESHHENEHKFSKKSGSSHNRQFQNADS